MKLDLYMSFVAVVLVLLTGRILAKNIKFLRDYNIPEPVIGGIVAAFIFFISHKYFDLKITIDTTLKDPLMLAFFTSIGLSADFSTLKRGGRRLVVFIIAVGILVFLQNILGISIALAMGENPLLGLLGGSITMSGGHGTGAAWADTFIKAPYTYAPALEIAMAAATFGLVSGGIIGGPVAKYLITKHKLKASEQSAQAASSGDYAAFEEPHKERLITASSFIESLALIAIALFVGNLISGFLKGSAFSLPTFVWCLFIGVILRNTLQGFGIFKIFDREVAVLGDVSLALFLAIALMSINLLELVSLAVPMLVILCAQVAMMIFFAIFVTFRMTGKDYDAAVMSAGHCGFGLGATPTAMVNMQTVTARHGASHMAFIVVPLTGAFFVDLINATAIKLYLLLPFFPA